LRKEKTDDLTLEALKFREINGTGYLVGVKHTLNGRFDEEDGDVPHDFPDNEVATEFFNPRPIPLKFRFLDRIDFD
jgi:hypothetical protein